MVDKSAGGEKAEGQRCTVDGLEFGFTLLFLLIAAISWMGISLAEVHYYWLPMLILAGLLLSGVGGYLAIRSIRKSLLPWNAIPTSTWVPLVCILIVGGFLFF